MVDRILSRSRSRWYEASLSLFTPITKRWAKAAWLWSTAGAALFAASEPVILRFPTLGHALILGNLLAILLPAIRFGWRGAGGGLLLSLSGYFAAVCTIIAVGSVPLPGAGDVIFTLTAALLLAILGGILGNSVVRYRRLAEQMAGAERRLSSLINGMPSGLLVVDRRGKVVFSNATARTLLNTEAPEEFDIAVRDLVAAESWEELRRHLVTGMTAEPIRVTIPWENPVRTEWVFSQLSEDGERYTLAFFWNAEEKLRREEETRALTAALRCLQEGVVLADFDGTIRYVNPAAARIYGYAEQGEVVGSDLRTHLAPASVEGFQHRMEEARSTGGCNEIRIRRPDGGETEVNVTTSPVKMDGALIGTIGVLRDLTEAKVLARRATAADKQAALGRLVAGAAHEINNPLTAIVANVELLRTVPGLPAGVEPALELVLGECGRAGRIVRDLLAFARQRPVTRTPVELATVVREAVALREAYARAAGIELTLDTPSSAPVQVDVDQVKQVVLNLIANAEDAVTGTEVKRISVTIGRRGGRALLLVNDSGAGVPEAIQHQIFEPFFTTKPEGQGTGLGLAVSAGILSEHGGKISVGRGVLGGAQFAVELPLTEAAAIVPPVAGEATSLPSIRRRHRILLVDDETAILSAVGRILQSLGHEVKTAATGGDGLALALTEEFDVIISDLRMPGLSGRELHAELTREGILPRADFIVATGDIADPEAFNFLQATGLPVLLKPFEIRSLVEMLGRCRGSSALVDAAMARAC